jgi:hypothetical protein
LGFESRRGASHPGLSAAPGQSTSTRTSATPGRSTSASSWPGPECCYRSASVVSPLGRRGRVTGCLGGRLGVPRRWPIPGVSGVSRFLAIARCLWFPTCSGTWLARASHLDCFLIRDALWCADVGRNPADLRRTVHECPLKSAAVTGRCYSAGYSVGVLSPPASRFGLVR